MKIDLKKEISLPKLRKPSLPSGPKLSRKSDGEKAGRRSLGGPELHAPKLLTDLYADLRDRRLLPLVVLLIAAMIAAPILLPNGGDHEEAAASLPVTGGEGETKDATLTVVPAETGLHDYKKRLGHRAPLNPFRRVPGESAHSAGESQGSEGGSGPSESEPEAEPEGGPEAPTVSSSGPTVSTTVGGVTTEVPASSVESTPAEQPHETHHKTSKTETAGSESSTGPTESVESTPPPTPVETTEPTTPTAPVTPAEPTHTESTTTESSETSKTSTTESSKTQTSTDPAAPQPIVGYAIDAEAGFVPHTTEKTELAPMTKLPNAKHPLVLYMGLSKNHKRALFLMTSNVTAYYGGHCALDKSSCQLVEVQAGKGITFADGYGESRYKVHLKRIVPLRFSK
jgi:hypothetical protein